MVEHRGADTRRHDTPVQLDARFHLIEPQRRPQRDRLAENDGTLLCVIRQHQRDLPGITARLGDLERRVNDGDRRAHLLRRHLARKRPAQPHAKLGFEAGSVQLPGREHVTARPCLQDAAKAGLVKPELLLNRLGGQADLPADLPLALGAATLDQRQLDAVRLV